MTPIETILGGIVIAVISGGVGRVSNRTKVSKSVCDTKHDSLEELLDVKFEALREKIINAINGRE